MFVICVSSVCGWLGERLWRKQRDDDVLMMCSVVQSML